MTTKAARNFFHPEPASNQSTFTVVLAFAVNLVIAIAKSVAAVLTGSASMTAEAAHSWSDAGNEIFLLVADRRSRKPRDRRHPMGYGREAYVWSMFAAFGLFVAGAVVSFMHGIQQLITPEPASDFVVAYVVLAVSFVLEGISFSQAWRQAHRMANRLNRATLEHVVNSSNPTMRAVFAEDAAALIGLAIAFAGVLAHQLSGNPVPDALGSILVGVLLGVVALILIDRNRRFLVGEPAQRDVDRLAVGMLLERPEIERVTYMHLEFVGPERLYLVAAVDMTGDFTETHVAVELRRVERELEENPLVEEAVLTLSTPEEKSIQP